MVERVVITQLLQEQGVFTPKGTRWQQTSEYPRWSNFVDGVSYLSYGNLRLIIQQYDSYMFPSSSKPISLVASDPFLKLTFNECILDRYVPMVHRLIILMPW